MSERAHTLICVGIVWASVPMTTAALGGWAGWLLAVVGA